jgi:lipopolysaccharide export system protein LptA
LKNKIIYYIVYIILFLIQNEIISNSRPPLLLPPISVYESGRNIPNLPADKTGKASRIPTSWGGGALVQEDKIYQGFPITSFSLTEGAWIQHRNIRLTSSHIEIIGSDALVGLLRGSVKVEDKDNKVTLTSDKGIYDKLQETVILEGRPTLFYYNANSKLTKLTSNKIVRYIKENKISLEGSVIVQDPDYTILSNSAVYFEKDGLLELENQPFIFGSDTFLTAKSAGYNNQTKITYLKENTVLLRVSKENIEVDENSSVDLENKSKEKKIITTFSGNLLESISKNKERDQMIKLHGDSKVLREDYVFRGNILSAFGENYKNLESNEEFTFLDIKGNLRILGSLFEHNELIGYTHITKNPSIEFINSEGQITSTLTTVEIERFSEKNEIVARGNVLIDSENGKIRGQYATYYEKDKVIHVEGNPSIEREGSKIYCGMILIYPDSNRIIMSDGIGVIKEK